MRRFVEAGMAVDELDVLTGALRKGQVRKCSYAVVSLPARDAQVLVCDESGEATYVCRGIRDDSWFAKHTKGDLSSDPDTVRAVALRDTPMGWRMWGDNVLGLLGMSVTPDAFASSLRSEYPTAESWFAIDRADRPLLAVAGIKYGRLGGRITGRYLNPYLNRDHVAFAEALYGMDDPLVFAERARMAL